MVTGLLAEEVTIITACHVIAGTIAESKQVNEDTNMMLPSKWI